MPTCPDSSPRFVPAINGSVLVFQWSTSRRISTEPPPSFNSGRDIPVEAASPVLIEKVRSVTTDATGQYRIVDLRPGTYSVTFSLPGFTTVKREGIELSGDF